MALPPTAQNAFSFMMNRPQVIKDSGENVKEIHEYLDRLRVNYTDRAATLKYDAENPLLFKGERDVSGGQTLHAYRIIMKQKEALEREIPGAVKAAEDIWASVQTETSKDGREHKTICPGLLAEIIRFAQPILNDINSSEGISTELRQRLGDDDESCNMVLRAFQGMATYPDDDGDKERGADQHGIERSQNETSLLNDQKEKDEAEREAQKQSSLLNSRLQAKDDIIQARNGVIHESNAAIEGLMNDNSSLVKENERLRSRVRQLDQVCQRNDSLRTTIQRLVDLGSQEPGHTNDGDDDREDDAGNEDAQSPSDDQTYKDYCMQLNCLVRNLRIEKSTAIENAEKANAAAEEETRTRQAKEVELEGAQKQIDRLSKSLETQQASLKAASDELIELQKTCEEWGRSEASLWSQRTALRIELKIARRDLERLSMNTQETIKGLENKLQEAKDDGNANMDQLRRQHADTVTAMNEDKGKAKELSDGLKATIVELDEKLDGLKATIAELNEKLEVARQDVTTTNQKKQQAEEESDGLQVTIDELNEKLEVARQDVTTTNQKKQQAEEQSDGLQATIDELNDKLKAERQNVTTLNQDKQQATKDAKEESDGLRAVIAGLKEKLVAAVQDKQHAKEQSDELQDTIAELNEKLEAAGQHAASHAKTLQELQATSDQLEEDFNETKEGRGRLGERYMEFFLGGRSTMAEELMREIAREDAEFATVDAGVHKPWLVEGTWTRAQQDSDYSHFTIIEVILRLPNVILHSEWNGNQYLALMRRLTELLSQVPKLNMSVIDLLLSVVNNRLGSLPSREQDSASVALWAMLNIVLKRWDVEFDNHKPDVLAASEEIMGNFTPNEVNENCVMVGEGEDKLYLVKVEEWPQAVVIKHTSRRNVVWFVDRDCGKREDNFLTLRGGPSKKIEVDLLTEAGYIFYLRGW
ncbi:hypothetical protein CkaCkLH20_09449 [Colletotrichum karsti]|uniref:Uncharacterized protein n=1 Tax=Colletotrichum karsti TaxID=1095194 RepID=A0A9P6LEA1_9PEZI|nr:uncharacterized protein CkaCkLH20_09449 [Colletotrichum karsti]KAF9872939.1 hypothetical protein CkaCkLH20_09449 [Colletotrichum karsti]